MFRIFFLLVAAIIVLSAATPATAAVTTIDTEALCRIPVLEATGHGEVMAVPERAVVRLGAEVQAEEASAAQNMVNEIMQRVISQIRALEIPAENIQTVGLTLTPVYSDEDLQSGREPTQPRIVGYRASNVVRVRVDDIDRVGDVIDAGVAAGANRLEGISFELESDAEYREALREAVQDAGARAEAMADALGVQLVSVLEVSEGTAQIFSPQVQFAQAFDTAATATPVEPGQVLVEAFVTVRYEISGGELPPQATGNGG